MWSDTRCALSTSQRSVTTFRQQWSVWGRVGMEEVNGTMEWSWELKWDNALEERGPCMSVALPQDVTLLQRPYWAVLEAFRAFSNRIGLHLLLYAKTMLKLAHLDGWTEQKSARLSLNFNLSSKFPRLYANFWNQQFWKCVSAVTTRCFVVVALVVVALF